MSPLQTLLPILSCPDDGGSLRSDGGSLQCTACERRFPVLAPNLVELLPSAGALQPDGSPYAAEYVAERNRGFHFREDAVAWGAPEYRPGEWVERKYRQVDAVRSLLLGGVGPGAVLCDFSAGAGYYTFAYARDWPHVVHCDLSVDALNYAHRKAERMGLRNILFCPNGMHRVSLSWLARPCSLPGQPDSREAHAKSRGPFRGVAPGRRRRCRLPQLVAQSDPPAGFAAEQFWRKP